MKEKKPMSHLIAGLVIGMVLIVLSFILEYLEMEYSTLALVSNGVVIIGGLILFISLYGKAMDYAAGYGTLFTYGFKAAVVLTLVVIAFTIIYILVLPEYKEKMIDLYRQELQKESDLMPSDVEEQVAMYRRMFWVSTIGPILLIFLIVGTLGAVIGAAVTKKKKVITLDLN